DIKQTLFLLLLLVPQGPIPGRKPGAPPSTPRPPRKSTVRISDLQLTPNPNLLPRQLFPLHEDDEDPEKENQPPTNEEELPQVQPSSELHRLLNKWDELIDQLLHIISQDLQGFKRKLGIPQ
ncbi:^E4, partial [Gammapapillomavirus sp.]|uniref:^E4 n=1 Tax=Gammapapillomavirus sp. TaxID=2049444 RepID=UPI000C557643